MGRDDDVVASYQLVRSQIRSLVVQHVRAERTELARIERGEVSARIIDFEKPAVRAEKGA